MNCFYISLCVNEKLCTYTKQNCLKQNCVIIHMWVNKWLMSNLILSDMYKYLEVFNFVDLQNWILSKNNCFYI